MRVPHGITGRVAAASAVATVAVVLMAGPALAHVTVAADDPTRAADDSILTFRVPNEEDAAATVKVDIKFPTKDPMASVRPAAKAGWTITTKTVKFDPPIKTDDGTITEGVGEVTFTASNAAAGIQPGDFGAFQVLVGPLPDAPSVAFPTVQTYSNGKVSSWVEPVTDPENPPDNPTPVLTLAASSEAGSTEPSPSASPSATAAPAAAPDLSGYATDSEASTARTVGVLGLIVGLVGLVVAGIALVRTRRTASPPAPQEAPQETTTRT
jgi:uncharacterized protein YcnI